MPTAIPGRAPTLLARTREILRARHYSPRTEEAYLGWIRRFVGFHRPRHPRELAAPDIERFLAELAIQRRVSASTQSQALSALLFLYRDVLGRPLPWTGELTHARRPERLPVVLTREEVARLLAHLHGVSRLACALMYGSGLRLTEALELRVKDVDLHRREIRLRDGKGRKDRVTMLPAFLIEDMTAHLEHVRAQFAADLRAGAGHVALPDALRTKYPSASREWPWQWVFPARRHDT